MSEQSTAPTNGNGDADADVPLLLETATTWVQHDPNPTTAAHVEQLIHNNNESRSALRAMFAAGRIAFGTAGLRSSMAPGPLNMNDLVVVQAAQGIAQYGQRLFQQHTSSNTTLAIVPEDHKDKRLRVSNDTEGKKRLCVVIGYDHRASEEWNLSSRHFAVLTALVFQQLDDFEVVLLDGFVMTPLVPFAMQMMSQQQATTCYGIMVTASHNPKQDAGYKVYWSDGCQIRSPTDQHLAESIQANLTPWTDYAAVLQSRRATFPNDPCYGLSDPQQTQEYITEYFQSLLAPVGMLSGKSNANTEWNDDDATFSDPTQQRHPHRRRPTFCYTAMHGVGYRFAQQCFAICQLPPFVSVPQQQEPDPTFPTVSFPNPEEPGALDIALQYAAEHDCCIVLANDPDADRLAVAERGDPEGNNSCDNESNPWTIFTGDQIGVLLGHWLWKQHCQTNDDSNTVPAMCASTVSSRMLATIADVEGFHFEDTLTGFKWIGSRAAALHGSPVVLVEAHQSSSAADSAPSSTATTHGSAKQQISTYKTLFCYEEAIGFCCGSVIFDKDGISALGVFAELAYKVYSRGLTLRQHLQSLYDKYGEFVSNNGYFIMKDNRVVGPIMDRITNYGAFDTLARSVGPYPVASVRYLGEPGYDSLQLPDHKPTLPCSRSAPMVTLRFENGCVAQFRASGTEPKFKYYLELKGQPGVPRETVARELQIMSNVLLDTLLEPEKNGLERPQAKQ